MAPVSGSPVVRKATLVLRAAACASAAHGVAASPPAAPPMKVRRAIIRSPCRSQTGPGREQFSPQANAWAAQEDPPCGDAKARAHRFPPTRRIEPLSEQCDQGAVFTIELAAV